MKINCIIIDDEVDAREGLKLLLQNDSEINVISACADGLEAIIAIDKYKPDLVLLDIQMPGANGFEVLNNIKQPIPEVIFITAYDQFAIKAFEVHALDYLLKPFTDHRFYEAIANAKKKLLGRQSTDELTSTMQMVQEVVKHESINQQITATADGRLAIKADGKIHFIEKENILWIEAYDYYIKIHTTEHLLLARETMKNVLSKLGDNFIRIHKSSIINIKAVKSFGRMANNELEIELVDGNKLKVSRSYKSDFTKKVIPPC